MTVIFIINPAEVTPLDIIKEVGKNKTRSLIFLGVNKLI